MITQRRKRVAFLVMAAVISVLLVSTENQLLSTSFMSKPATKSPGSSYWILAEHNGVTCLCDSHTRNTVVLNKQGSCVLAVEQPTSTVTMRKEWTKSAHVDVVVPDVATAAVVKACSPFMYTMRSNLTLRISSSDQRGADALGNTTTNETTPEYGDVRPLLVGFVDTHKSPYHWVVGPDATFQVTVTANVIASWLRIPTTEPALEGDSSPLVNRSVLDLWLSGKPQAGKMQEFWSLGLPHTATLVGGSFFSESNTGGTKRLQRHRHIVLGIFKAHNLFWPPFVSWWPFAMIGDKAIRHPGSAAIDANFASFAKSYATKSLMKFNSSLDGSGLRHHAGPIVLIEKRPLDIKPRTRIRGMPDKLFEDLKAAVKFRKLRVYPQHIFENHVPLKHQFSAVQESDLVIAAEGAFVTHQLWSRPGTTWAVVYKIEPTRWWWEYRHYQYHTTMTRAVKGVKLIVFEVHPGHSPPALGELVVQAALAAHGSMQPGEVQLIVLGSVWTRLGVALGIAIAPTVNWLGGTTAGRLVLGGAMVGIATGVVWICRQRRRRTGCFSHVK